MTVDNISEDYFVISMDFQFVSHSDFVSESAFVRGFASPAIWSGGSSTLILSEKSRCCQAGKLYKFGSEKLWKQTGKRRFSADFATNCPDFAKKLCHRGGGGLSDLPRMLLPPCEVVVQNDRRAHRVEDVYLISNTDRKGLWRLHHGCGVQKVFKRLSHTNLKLSFS